MMSILVVFFCASAIMYFSCGMRYAVGIVWSVRGELNTIPAIMSVPVVLVVMSFIWLWYYYRNEYCRTQKVIGVVVMVKRH